MLTVITPAPKGLVTLAAVKAELEVSGTADDTVLSTMIRQASADIVRYCNRPFLTETVRETFRLDRGWDVPVGFPGTAMDGVCRGVDGLLLRRYPVTDVDSITEAGITVALEAVQVDSENGVLRRVDDGWPAVWWEAPVVVEYTGGYELEDLPEDVSRACTDLVKLRYFSRSRDPALRSERILDLIDTSFTAANSATVKRGLPLEIAQRVDDYRLRDL